MNESQWLECSDLDVLIAGAAQLVPARKLLLFATACSRRAWGLVTDDAPAASPDHLETIAEEGPQEHLGDVRTIIRVGLTLAQAIDDLKGSTHAMNYRASMTLPGAVADLASMARKATATVRARAGRSFYTVQVKEHTFQMDLLRDIVGNPFRKPNINPHWLTVYDGIVRQMAAVIEEERDFGRVSVLGDALEDVGCTDDVLLSHCRGAGPHARGCWVVDLILGRG